MALVVARCGMGSRGRPQWRIPKGPRPTPDLLAVARMAPNNVEILDFYLISRNHFPVLPLRSGIASLPLLQGCRMPSFEALTESVLQRLLLGGLAPT